VLLGLVALLAATTVAIPTGGVPKPPVIHEVFTQLPCPAHPVSTLEMEGCFEKTIVSTDRKIDAQAKAIFGLLRSRYARLTFIRGERSWLQYRQASCSAQASKYAGGTFAGVVAAACTVDRSKAHLRDLVAMRKELSFH
jgi:uncharacterized protein YecT (DUF1311 family)